MGGEWGVAHVRIQQGREPWEFRVAGLKHVRADVAAVNDNILKVESGVHAPPWSFTHDAAQSDRHPISRARLRSMTRLIEGPDVAGIGQSLGIYR